jgi:hypothetical protein
MPYINRPAVSCGVREIKLYQNDTIAEVIQALTGTNIPAMYIFGTTKKQVKPEETIAEQLVAMIKEHDLGLLQETATMKNKSRKEWYKAWIWTPNTKLEKFLFP